MTNKKQNGIRKLSLLMIIMFVISIFEIGLINAEGITSAERVGVLEPRVCCEKTNSGLFCQEVPEAQCASDRMAKTSCESTSFCNSGYCFDSIEGTCLDNVPQAVCDNNGGTWNAEKPAQCDLGCCLLNDQASFSTLVRCKRLSAFYGLETNWNPEITNEAQCISSAGLTEKGACVFTQDFDKTCKMTTKEECTADVIGTAGNVLPEGSDTDIGLVPSGASANVEEDENNEEDVSSSPDESGVEFFPGKLCTAEELGVNCAPTKQTTCLPGKEEVYFVDTCGNAGNIYDAGKANNKRYWSEIIDKGEACNPNSDNGDDPSCGNCNYLFGSYCRASSSETAQPRMGTNICQSLNCVDEKGEEKQHGESWCVYDVQGRSFAPQESASKNYVAAEIAEALNKEVSNSVSSLRSTGKLGSQLLSSSSPTGSRFYRKICINGRIQTEPCADFRQEECLQNSIDTPQGEFTEAACRVNRWQDCTAQRDLQDCTNTDKRDCRWLEGVQYILMGALMNGTSLDSNSLAGAQQSARSEIDAQGGRENIPKGACVPKISPGLKFYQGEEAKTVCSQGNALCPVKYEKGIGGDWECVENCECDPNENPSIVAQRAQLCAALGDCGPKVNFVGSPGYTRGYEVKTKKIKKDDD